MASNSKYILSRRRRRRSLPFPIVVVIIVFFVIVLHEAPGVTIASAYAFPPPWSPTYNTTESLITMQCNSSGYSDPHRGSEFGIVSYDWSNAKRFWAQNQPMDCEEKLIQQVELLAVANKKEERTGNNNNINPYNKRIFIYRNIVKALPWFSTVRNKLLDPAYDGFFLKFNQDQQQQYDDDNDNDNDNNDLLDNTNNDDDNYHVPKCAAENKSICSDLYHDQGQTPQVPTKLNPNPDGHCNPDLGCNCGGNNLPCGEYLFDHRNGTMLRTWLIEEVLLGPTGIGHKYVDGVFLDDYWCSDLLCSQSNNDTNMGCPCNDPKQGPTEINQYAAIDDIGLSDIDIMDITLEWNKTMNLAMQKILQRKAYTWSLMDGQQNANAQPYLFNLLPSIAYDNNDDDNDNNNNDNDNRNSNNNKISERCIEILEDACRDDSDWQLKPRLFGFTVNATSNYRLSQFELDWSFFLLVRGNYTWAGYGIWGMTWPFNYEPSHGQTPAIPHGGVPLPKLLTPDGSIDYGMPLGTCYQTTSKSSTGIFRRNWTNGYVEMNCNNKQQHQHQHQHKYNKINKINDHSESIVGGVVTSQLIFNNDLPHKKENEDAHTYSTS